MNNNNSMKKIHGFASPPAPRSEQNEASKSLFAPNRSNQHLKSIPRTADQGAVFRSVSMGTQRPPVFQHTKAHELTKSHSVPIPRPFHVSPPVTSKVRSASGTKWIVTMEELPSIPIYHPIERTAVTISDIPLETIVDNVANFLREKSIVAEFEVSKVKCLTSDMLNFSIHLWRCSKGITIEVQRIRGCCVSMHAVRRDIIHALRRQRQLGSSIQVSKPATEKCVVSMVERSVLPPPPSVRSCTKDAMDIVRSLLQSERQDAQRLGLESLSTLTCPTHTALVDQSEVSTTLLCESDWQGLLEYYFEPKVFDTEKDLQFLALRIVAQALEALTNGAQVDLSTRFWTTVSESIHRHIASSTETPLEATLSIRCLRQFHRLDPSFDQRTQSYNTVFRQHMKKAQEYGHYHNRSLELESTQWMESVY